jgi:hypothetical protein
MFFEDFKLINYNSLVDNTLINYNLLVDITLINYNSLVDITLINYNFLVDITLINYNSLVDTPNSSLPCSKHSSKSVNSGRNYLDFHLKENFQIFTCRFSNFHSSTDYCANSSRTISVNRAQARSFAP